MDAGYRVLRGGSWNNNNQNLRASNRNNNNPNNSNNNNGFRCASELSFAFRMSVVHGQLNRKEDHTFMSLPASF